MYQSSFFNKHNRQTIALMALFALFLVNLKSAQAAPVDPLTGSTPSFDAAPEEGTNYNSGDWGVSEQNGAATYTFPINIPTGRNGMAPSLALRYSSNLPLRGGLAVGWNLHIPSVEKDFTLGFTEETHYKIDLGSASGRLVEVSDITPFPNGKAYRVNFDNSNTRIFSISSTGPRPVIEEWIALTPDGIRHHFEESHSGSINGVVWHITSQVDPHGNTIRYNWSDIFNTKGIYLGQSLTSIEYTSNESAGLIPHAKVEFEYDPMQFCFDTDTSTTPPVAIISDIPIGAAYRKGGKRPQNVIDEFEFIQVTGAQQLSAVKIHVRDTQTSDWRLSKRIDLTYQHKNSILYKKRLVVAPINPLPPHLARCKQNPLRYLTQIDVKAFNADGVSTPLPPVNFEYNHRLDISIPRIIPGISGNEEKEQMPLITVNAPGFGQEGTSGTHLGGLKTTLLDIDNDGIRDRVSVTEENKVCTLVWHKGELGGTFDPQPHKSPLPTAAWYQEWRGIPNAVLDDKEGCTLSGQVAYRSASISNPLADGTPNLDTVMAKGIVSYHFMDYTGDGRLDLITNVWESAGCDWTYDPWTLNAIDNGTCAFNQGDETQTLAGSSPPIKPESRGITPNEDFIWRVYPGTGNPSQPFLNNPVHPIRITVASPLELPPSASEEEIDTTQTVNYSVPALFDLDGDGFLDIIASGKDAQKILCNNKILLKSCDWTVYLGNGTHKFPKKAEAHIWDVPTPVALASDEWSFGTVGGTEPFVQSRATVINLHDINGDGLADLIVRRDDGKMYSYRNAGSGFDNQAHPLNGTTVLERIQTDIDKFIPNTLTSGDRGYLRRLLDLDGDGLLDMVWFESNRKPITSTNFVKAKFNLGDRFGNEVTLLFPEKWARSKRLLSAKWQSGFEGTWHIATDFTDVSGDGVADLVQWHGSTMSYIRNPGLPSAPDLLRKVTNGRGMELTFSYAPSTNRDVVTRTDNNSTLPSVTWVVKKTTVKGGFDTPTTTTQYQYQNPNYLSAGDYTGFKERSQFVGFYKHIQTTTYANGTSKQIRKNYNYTGLHGELINTQIFLDGQLHRAIRKEWDHKTLFNDRIQVALPVLTTTCIANTPNISEEDCFAQNDHVHRIEKKWQSNDVSNQFLNTQNIEGSGILAQTGDHSSSYLYDIRYGTATANGPEDYRVRVLETKEAVRDALGNFDTLIGRSITDFNIETGLPDKIHSFFDTSVIATINFSYDALTGNLLKMQKPMQSLLNGGTDTFADFNYDSHKLFVHETRNELGHLTITSNDVATGALIKREGPNAIMSPSQTVFDTERWKIDGFGRVLSRSISIDTQINGSANYKEHLVERNTFNDLNFIESGNPVSVRAEQLRDFDGTHWIPTEQDFDGKGRVLKTRQLFNGDIVTHTVYRYDDIGSILSIETADPRNAANLITYTYSRDGLGRVTHLQRPDNTSISISYEGLLQTISEVTPDSTGGSRTMRSDVFGRLVELQEHNSGTPSAITRYQYDAVDNLQQITDAEGNITRMSHDWQGNRIAINRGLRSWLFHYDLNGNINSKLSPVPPGSDAFQYTTNYTYDDLDRPRTKNFIDLRLSKAPSSIPDNTLAPAGVISTIQYHYDNGHNGIGHLRLVDLPFGVIEYNYDVRGLLTHERRSFTLNQIANMSASQLVRRTYNALGQLTESNWQGGQRWRISYDERGLVHSVDWFDPMAIAWQSVANYERDLTGLPLARNTSYGQTRHFTYDALARPLTDNIILNAGTTNLAERSYKYTGAGNLASVTGHTNGINANASYTYDLQHRLLTAVAPNGYQGRFTYSPTGNVLSANVTWNNSPETRNVNYSYGQVDPQAVDKLQNVTTGSNYADFAYDDSGNMTWRSTPDGDSLLHWDGQDQIRHVDTPDGSETYYYDHDGQRMLVVNPDQGVRFWFGEREIYYNLDGTETLNYLHLSAGGPTLARIENATKIELQYADALQNLMFSLDKDSNVTASFLYGSFGEVVSDTGSEAHRRQFNGKENDVVTGLRYYGYRYYDPLILRWNSADPLYTLVPELGGNQPQRMNLYAFSMNNPVRYMDPDGLLPRSDGNGGTIVDTPDGPMECEGGVGSSDCMYHKPIYGEGSPYGGTIFGRTLINSGAIKVNGSAEDISDFALLLTEAARNSLAAMSYMGKMKMKTKDLSKNHNHIVAKLVRNRSFDVDDWVSGNIDLFDIENLPLNERVLNLMHVVVERWHEREWLYDTEGPNGERNSWRIGDNPFMSDPNGLTGPLEKHYQSGHRAAIDFNNGIRRSYGLQERPHFNIFLYLRGIAQ